MLQNVSCAASASAVDALYKKSCQMLPQGRDTSVSVYLKQWGLCGAHVALAFSPTTLAHQGCEQAERSAMAAHQSIVPP